MKNKRKSNIKLFVVIFAFFASCQIFAEEPIFVDSQNAEVGWDKAQVENPRVQWMKGKCGIMVHWLFPKYAGDDASEINRIVDAFDIDGFMEDFDATGAEWLIFTVGQNTGAYASPNSVIEKYAGKGHCSKRDLVLEIAKAVHLRGKRFILYVPCEVRGNGSMRKSFCWNNNLQDPKIEFQQRWTEVLREWSLRLGKYCDGWWLDGAYKDIAPHIDWRLWHSALRAGNSDAVVTFNAGYLHSERILLLDLDHDYLAGETIVLLDGKIRMGRNNADTRLYLPSTAYYRGTKSLWHILFPMDGCWSAKGEWTEWMNVPWDTEKQSPELKISPPVYSRHNIQKFLNSMSKVGAAVTINMGITEDGRLSRESIKRVKK